MNNTHIISLPEVNGDSIRLTLSGSDTLLIENNSNHLILQLINDITGDDKSVLNVKSKVTFEMDDFNHLLSAALDYLFSRDDKLTKLTLSPELAAYSNSGIVHSQDTLTGMGTCYRSGFYQSPLLWHEQRDTLTTPEIWTSNAEGTAHPLRQQQPDGTLYQRYDYQSDLSIAFRTFDPDRDLDTFHQWMNQPRVAEFWEMAHSKKDLAHYIQTLLNDRKSWPLIASFDGVPFGYMEVYWAMEDRIAPYYDCQPWDRGYHVLIGNTRYLGPRYSQCWTRSISHFLFLDDPRTSRLVGEPRADNQKVMKLLAPAGWEKIKEFDFPHKRSALVSCRRSSFFQDILL